MAVHIVIPARYASTRLPGKPLVDILGEPMIVRVVRQAALIDVQSITVATDDERVLATVKTAGYDAMMTSPDHESGSDRVKEVADRIGFASEDIVINLQGDEPLLPLQALQVLIEGLQANEGCGMATLSEPIDSFEMLGNPNVVKVVLNERSRALYFSRAPIPYPRDVWSPTDTLPSAEISELLNDGVVRRHVGIYGFRMHGLARFVALPPSRLESIEKLEQLRWLEAGEDLLVLDAGVVVPGGIDTQADLDRVLAALKQHGE